MAAASGIALTMIVPDPDRGKLQVVRDYQSAMRAAGHNEFSQGSLEAYINARVLLEALERAGKDVKCPFPLFALEGFFGLR